MLLNQKNTSPLLYHLLSGATFSCEHAMLSLPCNNTFVFCYFALSSLIQRNVTYHQNCSALGRKQSICFQCLIHKAGLICQNNRYLRALPQRRLSRIDHLLSRLSFLKVMAAFSVLSCLMGLLFLRAA